MEKVKTYPGGLRLVMKRLDGVYSVSTGIYVGAGSSDETQDISGISHFIEHMMFKGTKQRSAFEIADQIDSMGAQINAFTTKEMTCYYTKSTADHFRGTLEVLSDIVFNSVFDETETEREKGVILEEISMVEDAPDELCNELLAEAFYGGTPYSRPILGSAANVKNFTRADILDYTGRMYTPANMVVSVAGYFDFDQVEDIVGELVASRCVQGAPLPVRPNAESLPGRVCHRVKDIEQANISLAFPGIPFEHEDVNAYALVSSIFGGGMSSRLFQQIRERQGLAYSVYSYTNHFRGMGSVGIYAGVNPKKGEEFLQSVSALIKEISTGGVTHKEFERGKEQLKSSLVFGQESTSTIMNAFGKYMLMTGKVLSLEKKVEDIQNLKYDYVNSVAARMISPGQAGAAYVGPDGVQDNILQILQG